MKESIFRPRVVLGQVIVVLVVISANVSAQTHAALTRYLPGAAPAVVEELLRDGMVEFDYMQANDAVLVPDHPLAAHIRSDLRSTRPNIMTERLMVVPTVANQATMLTLYNSLRRVSQLTGLEYYNARKNRTHVLFGSSHAVQSQSNPQPIPDPVVRAIPRDAQVTVLQDTPPFGAVFNEYRYRFDGSAFLFSSSNLSPLLYNGMRVVRPSNMITHILVVPTDTFLLVYGVGGVRAFTAFGLLDDRIGPAFSGRVGGLFGWYYEEYLAKLR